MSSFLQTSHGDLDMSSGNLVLVQDPSFILAQKLTNQLRLILGEWFQDTRVGVPYFQHILIKNPDLRVIGQIFRSAFLQTPGVAEILSADLQFITTNRTLLANFKILTDTGAILEGGIGTPFIITLQGTSE